MAGASAAQVDVLFFPTRGQGQVKNSAENGEEGEEGWEQVKEEGDYEGEEEDGDDQGEEGEEGDVVDEEDRKEDSGEEVADEGGLNTYQHRAENGHGNGHVNGNENENGLGEQLVRMESQTSSYGGQFPGKDSWLVLATSSNKFGTLRS